MVLETINGTLESLGKNGIESKYFDKVKEYMQKQYQENQRENSVWSSIIRQKAEFNVDFNTGYLDTLNATTAKQVQQFINEVVLKQGNRVEVIMVPQD